MRRRSELKRSSESETASTRTSEGFRGLPFALIWLAMFLICTIFVLIVLEGRQSLTRLSSETLESTDVELVRLEQLVSQQNRTIALLRQALEFTQVEHQANKKVQAVAATAIDVVASQAVGSKRDWTSKHIEADEAQDGPKPETASSYEGHHILTLSDAELRGTPMDELMATYGKTRGGGSCERDFGNELVNRWRAERKTYCEPKFAGGTKIECFLVKQTAHHGHGDNLCLATSASINFKDLADGVTAPAYFERYVRSRHQQQYSKIQYSRGTLAGTCVPEPSRWRANSFPGWNVNWFHAFESVEHLRCDVWEEKPTLIVERDTFANLFHNSEDFFNTQLAMAILKWATRDIQILITDIFPKGPFWPMWTKVFRGTSDPLAAFDIAEKYQNSSVCFKQVAIAILGAAAPVTVASFDTRCSHSPLVRSYADFVPATLGLAAKTRYARAAAGDPTLDPKRVMVTFMARRSSTHWPEKRFCDSQRSYFKCERLAHLGVRKLGRSVKNDPDVVEALKSLEHRSFQNGAYVQVQDVDYSLLDYEAQIAHDLDTDVMVGTHGAGLLHNIFMPDRAVLVELFVDSSQANRHFHNFATWQGRKYISRPMFNPIPTKDLINLVTQAIEAVDLSRPY